MCYYFNGFLLFLACSGILTNSVSAMEQRAELFQDGLQLSAQIAPRISKSEFRRITEYALSYLKKNEDKITCEMGESGFVRISLPPENEELSCNEESCYVEKIRINYWPSSIRLDEENIHNHTRNFESIVIRGGYSHKCYAANDCENGDHIRYRINRGGSNQGQPLFGSRTNLALSQTESYRTSDTIVYPTKIIHRISSVAPNTLSLNVVFKESNDYYDIFLPADTPDDFKIQMNFLSESGSKQFKTEMMELLENALNGVNPTNVQ